MFDKLSFGYTKQANDEESPRKRIRPNESCPCRSRRRPRQNNRNGALHKPAAYQIRIVEILLKNILIPSRD